MLAPYDNLCCAIARSKASWTTVGYVRLHFTDTMVQLYPVGHTSTYMYSYISDGCRWHCGMLTNRTQRANVQSAKDPTHNLKLEVTAVTVTD